MKELKFDHLFSVVGGVCEQIDGPQIILLECPSLANQHADIALALQILEKTGKSVKVIWKEDTPSGHSQLVWQINR